MENKIYRRPQSEAMCKFLYNNPEVLAYGIGLVILVIFWGMVIVPWWKKQGRIRRFRAK